MICMTKMHTNNIETHGEERDTTILCTELLYTVQTVLYRPTITSTLIVGYA